MSGTRALTCVFVRIFKWVKKKHALNFETKPKQKQERITSTERTEQNKNNVFASLQTVALMCYINF